MFLLTPERAPKAGPATCLLYCYYMVIIWLYGDYMVIIRLLYDHYMIIIWLLCGLLYGCFYFDCLIEHKFLPLGALGLELF